MDEASARASEAAGKAVAETMRFGSKVADLASGAGSYLSRTLGTIPEDLLGVLGGDWLHEKRRRNLASMQAVTADILDRLQPSHLEEPSPSVVLPLLATAADESRESLQTLWAALLASAFLPAGSRRVRRAFFETLKQMEPDDALLFAAIAKCPPRKMNEHVGSSDLVRGTGMEGPALAVAEEALVKLSLINHRMSGPVLTAYGFEFWKACNPE